MSLVLANNIIRITYIVFSLRAEPIVIVCPYASIDYDVVNVYEINNDEFDENYSPDLSCVDDVEVFEYGNQEAQEYNEPELPLFLIRNNYSFDY